MTMIRKLFITMAFLVGFMALAQEQELVTDRPDITESALVVPGKNIQLETGVSIEDFGSGFNVYNVPTFLFRIGFNNRFELRLGSTYSFTNQEEGFNATEIGLKINMNEDRSNPYQHAILLGVGIPYLVDPELRDNTYTTPNIMYAFQFNLAKNIGFSSNLGAVWDTKNQGALFIYSASLGYSISEKVGLYLEIFGNEKEKGESSASFDGGFTYLINPTMQLDASYGTRISPNTDYQYLSLGYTWRFKI